MTDWVLVPCLKQLFAEFNLIAPGRDHASDGSIGNKAHQATKSDHNPDGRGLVHAIDVDRDLRTPGLDMQDVVDHLVRRCKNGAERRLTYIIFNRRIWSATHGWNPRPYSGANPHDHHMHVSASDNPNREADAASWHLEELVAGLTREDVRAELTAFFNRSTQDEAKKQVTSRIGRDALDQSIPNGVVGGKSPAWAVLRDLGAAVTALAKQQGLSTAQLAEAISNVDDEVLEALADAGRSDEDVAAALKAALGDDRAATVGRILAGVTR